MIKGRFIILGSVAALVMVVLLFIYQVLARPSPLAVTFLGYTNFVPGRLPFAVFAVTNTTTRPVQRWAWEIHLPSGLDGIGELGVLTLKPGQGEHIRVTIGTSPTWRLAILSTGNIKGTWNQLLIGTSLVASNQWDALQFDRSFSPWLTGP